MLSYCFVQIKNYLRYPLLLKVLRTRELQVLCCQCKVSNGRGNIRSIVLNYHCFARQCFFFVKKHRRPYFFPKLMNRLASRPKTRRCALLLLRKKGKKADVNDICK